MLCRKKPLIISFVLVFVVAAGMLARHRTASQGAGGQAILVTHETKWRGIPDAPAAVLISTNRAGDRAVATPHFANARSFYTLAWGFGGKAQRGWYLYATLIGKLVGSDDAPSSLAFATAVARWQGSVGLSPSGVIDQETLMRIIKTWQEQRSADRSYPTAERLITAPASEFYDPERAGNLRQVERETYLAYKRMLHAAIADRTLGLATNANGELAANEMRLRIISAFRSREYQQQLRRQSPHSGRAGLAVNSPHFTGRALDLYIAGEPVETKDGNRALQVNALVYRWLVRNAHRFGFRPYFYEPWHWEYDHNFDQCLSGC